MAGIALKNEWHKLMIMSGVAADKTDKDYNAICDAYSQSHRYYHTLEHLQHMLGILQQVAYNDCAGLWAVWYHDYIYRPGKNNNEQKSAQYAKQVMSNMGLDKSLLESTHRIILATKDHQAKMVDENILSVLDADMAILGEPPDKYESYRQAISAEFQSVPAMAFRLGREKFIQTLLQQKQIYKTTWFYEKYESQARANLASELQVLK